VDGPGYNAVVDSIVAKHEDRVFRVNSGNEFSHLLGPELLQQEPFEGEPNYQIFRWKGVLRKEAEWTRSTLSPTPEERSAPHYSCIQVGLACELAGENWKGQMKVWRKA
jgi:hypothetical protein